MPWNLANPVKTFLGIIVRQHLTDRKQMGLLREQCAELRKGDLRYCFNQVWMKNGGADSMECYCYLRNIQDLLSDGKTPNEGGSECPLTDQQHRLEQWSNITLFLPKTCRDCMCLVRKSYQVYSLDMHYTRCGSGKETFWSQTLRNWKRWTHLKSMLKGLNAKEVLTSMGGEKFIFPIADGTIKLSGRDQVLRTSTLIRDRPDREEEQRNLLGESDGSFQPHFKTHCRMMVKQEMISGPFQGTLFTVITLNPESNCTCREKRHSQFH